MCTCVQLVHLVSEVLIFTTLSSEMYSKIASLLSISTMIGAVKCILYVFDLNHQFYVVYERPSKFTIQQFQSKLDRTDFVFTDPTYLVIFT